MTWIGDLSAPPEAQTLVNINMVRFITADQEEDGTLLVTLTMGAEQTVELRMTEESYQKLLELLGVQDVG